tara:strand:+ start:527 stop:1270 length:744 start_codon:yes stop_codon:yes gene_type:complete
MPALNEEESIFLSVESCLESLDIYEVSGEIIVINDGSTDKTQNIVESFLIRDSRVRVIKNEKPQGIGSSFWKGVDNAKGQAVVMLPGDNENDPFETLRYVKLIDHVDIIVPFIFNKEVRSLFRNLLSYVYRFIINSTFLVNFNYTNGTIIYRTSLLKELENRSAGFFFQTDILIRSVKNGYLFVEVPQKLCKRKSGDSSAVSFPSLLNVMRGYIKLVKDHYYGQKNRPSAKENFYSRDSATAKRRND